LILLQSSELVLREFERIRRKLYGYKPEKENNLSIAITTCLINNDLLRPFKYFALQFQNVEISILEVPYEQFPELLEVRQVDLAIGWPEDDAMGRLDLNPLLFGLWGIAVHRDHPAAKCDSIEWADIKNERFILPDYEYHFRKHVMRCRQHGFRPYVCCRTTSIVSSLLMVSRNLGVAFIPSFMCLEKYNELVRFVHLLPEEPVSLSIVKRRGNNAPVISEFIDFYTRIFSEQTPISVQTPAEG
jgi:DNA-binding transcriptional LysR family regulator